MSDAPSIRATETPSRARVYLRFAGVEARGQLRRVVGSRYGFRFDDARSYLSGRRPVLGYVGFEGKSNLGDEALFQAISGLVDAAPADGASVLSYRRHVPVELLAHAAVFRAGKLYSGVSLGGGTLINDRYWRFLDRAQRRGLPTYVFGTGVQDGSFWRTARPSPPFDRVQRSWDDVLKRVRLLGVRGPESKRLLAERGIEAEIIGDSAIACCESLPAERESTGRIGINVGCASSMFGDQDAVDRAVGDAAEALIARGHTVEFFALFRDDRASAERIIASRSLPCELWSESYDVAGFCERVGRYDAVIAEKLHGAVLAVARGVPTISLAYRPKCIDFMQSVDQHDMAVRTDRLDAAALLDRIDQIDADREPRTRTIIARCDEYRSRLRDFAARCVADLNASRRA